MKNSFARNLFISTLLCIIFVVLADDWLKILLLISIFITIPFLLFLVPTNKRDGSTSRFHTYLLGYHPYVAFTAGLSLVFPPGPISGALSVPWAIYLLALTLYGIRRILERGWYLIEENAIDMGLIYAVLGGIWLTCYCFGIDLFSSTPIIMLLNTVHIQFSAIFAPVFMGLVGRVLILDKKISPLYRWSTIAIMISPLLILIGIIADNWIESFTLILYACCLIVYSYFIFIHISKSIKRFMISLCLQISAAVTVLTFLLSNTIVYSYSALLGQNWFNLDQMVAFHVTTNAIGFILLGIIGWVYINPKEKPELYGLPNTNINGEKLIASDFFERNDLVTKRLYHAGLIDNLDRYARNDFFPAIVHPKIRSFYENTTLYDLAAQTTWHRGFGLFSKLFNRWSKRIQQLDVPVNKEKVLQLGSKIVGIKSNDQTLGNLRAWVRSDKETGKAIFVAVYADHQQENEHYVHTTLPVPKRNLSCILRLEHGSEECLQLTSLPRRGRKGDEGIYLMIKNSSIRLPFNLHFLMWVDEYGRLQATHRIWLFGLKMVTIEYEISGK